MLFFKAQVFAVDKLPHCLVVNLEAAPFQLGGQALQGKITALDAFKKPVAICANNLGLAIAAELQ